MAYTRESWLESRPQELAPDVIEAMNAPASGSRLTLAQVMADPNGAPNPNLYHETSGMTVQQFLASPYSPYVPNGDGTYTYRGFDPAAGWQNPSWIDQDSVGGLKNTLAFAGPALAAFTGVGAALGGFAGLGLGGIGGAGEAALGTGAMDMGVGLDAMRNSFLGLDAAGAGAGATLVDPSYLSNFNLQPTGLDQSNFLAQDYGYTQPEFGTFQNTYANPTLTEQTVSQFGLPDTGSGMGINSFGGMPEQSSYLAGLLGSGGTTSALGGGIPDITSLFSGALPSIMNAVPGAALGLAGGSAPSWLDQVVNGAGSLLGGNGGGGLLGNGLLGQGADLAARLAPGYAALKYAQNTDPYDTSRLESLYGQAGQAQNPFDYSRLTGLYDQLGNDPNLNPNLMSYDLASGSGRNRLQSNLARRGVSGSSFGNFDLNSYDAMRGLGRSAILGQGLQQQAGIANNLLTAQMNERRLLGTDLDRQAGIAKDLLTAQVQQQALKDARYGRAFDVFGRALSPGPTLYQAPR